ncbi:MAG TPA: PAC2 family protein [Micromonosporaceae bacterium]|nr:PAC2 family protein [Micromonosporaceae bacterium]
MIARVRNDSRPPPVATVVEKSALYELIGPLPELDRPVLVSALTGFVDAGNAAQLAREHLLARDATPVARFDVDRLLDYRSRRPLMTFVEDHWEDYAEPEIGLYLLRDEQETPFLVLAGPEPGLKWERFIADVTGLIRRLGVRLTVGFTAIPMAVPHTRPIGVTAHATRPELLINNEPWLSKAKVPATVGNLLEYRLGQAGLDAIGFAVHVPHYVAESAFPAAAEELLARLSKATGLLLPTGSLRQAAGVVRGEIDKQVAAADDAGTMVRMLEQQYDAFARGRQRSGVSTAEATPLPTADELGAELERFLAEQDRRDRDAG